MLLRLLTKFIDDANAASFVYIALILSVMAGVTAMSVEYGNALRVRTQLQSTAELAAIAAANALPNETAARTAAITYAQTNLPVADNGNVLVASDVEFGNWDAVAASFTVGATPTNAVRVTTRRSDTNGNALDAGFGAIFGTTSFNLSRSAVASLGTSPTCMIALDPTASDALEVNSNAQINIGNCEVHVASTSSSALYADSDAQINADRICVAGGYREQSNADSTPDPETGCVPPADPFASLPEPSYVGCDNPGEKIDNPSGSDSFAPTIPGGQFIFCGTLEITGSESVTFAPGTYIFDNSQFIVDSNASINGTNVFFYLDGTGSGFEFNSDTTINLTAPDAGTYAGILFMADNANTRTHKFDSNSAAVIDGVFYFPSARLEFNSNSTIAGSSSCTQFVASQIYMDSNSDINFAADLENCPQFSTLGGSGISLRQ